jgi:hypothetical protein
MAAPGGPDGWVKYESQAGSMIKTDGGKLKVSGTAGLNISDFNNNPPNPGFAGFGIKTGDGIKVAFEWPTAKAAPESALTIPKTAPPSRKRFLSVASFIVSIKLRKKVLVKHRPFVYPLHHHHRFTGW